MRKYTSTDLCFIESGIQPVPDVVAMRRKSFLESKLRTPNNEEPFHILSELCREADTLGYSFMAQALRYQCNIYPLDEVKIRVREKQSTPSKYVSYRTIINSQLSIHPI